MNYNFVNISKILFLLSNRCNNFLNLFKYGKWANINYEKCNI